MSEHAFFTADAKANTVAVVKEIEAVTSAEVVVAVRHRASEYREASYLFGFVCALAALSVLLFARQTFAVETMPLDVAFVFAVGALGSRRLPPLLSTFSTSKARARATHDAARAAFVDMGISKTRGRNGILVFVSMLERTVEVVPDVGIDAATMGDEWLRAKKALESSLRPKPRLARFLDALRAIAAPLAASMPHRPDDVNELPDEVA